MGIGRALPRHMLTLAVEHRDRFGCVGVLIDAKPDVVNFYASLGFVAVDNVREGHLHSEPIPLFLAIDTIASSLQG